MIYLGADHRGYHLKDKIKKWLSGLGFQVEDLGNYDYDEEDDYPDFARGVAERVSQNPQSDKGIVFCGSGVGVDIVANRFSGVRCGFVLNERQIEMAARDDQINMLAVATDFTPTEELQRAILTWLKTEANQAERYVRRIRKIDTIR
ncbi:RpiB/LacA/LacB family sugar-phosphate isomerase [Candidatus Parcubacteria bacterium]|nr:MAG: RpiB/LacA/LacB family sugar-phosphate isomerase [Candidatus Parcubacteria bacterium]